MSERPSPSRLELAVLRFIAERGPTTVGEAAKEFADPRGYVRTTVLTLMERLRKKGHLTRKKTRGPYRYSARVGKAELLQGLVREFVEETLGGSVSAFVAYLAEGAKLDAEEIKELAELVKELQSQQKENTS